MSEELCPVTDEELDELIKVITSDVEYARVCIRPPEVVRGHELVLAALLELRDLRIKWETLVRATLVEELTNHMENS